MNYDIHGLLKIKSNVVLPIPDCFLTLGNIDPDLTVLKEKLNFEKPKGCELRRINYHYWHEKHRLFVDYGLAGSKLIIENLLGRAKIRVSPNFYKYSAQATLDYLLSRVLFIKLIEKGYTFLHAGCVSRDGEGVLVTAMPDMGKTSTVLSLVGGGFSFLGDDHVIFSKNGTVYSYPREVTISPDTLTGGIVSDLPRWKRMLVRIRSLKIIMEKFFGSIAESKKVPHDVMKSHSKASLAFMLGSYGNEVRHVSKEKLANMMLLPIPAMDGFPDSFADLYLYLEGVDFAEIVDRGRGIMRRGLEHVKCYEVSAPSLQAYPKLIGEKIEQMA